MTMLQKTRFVCVSDTHGYTPSEAGFNLPAGDVLIHAGDLTNNGSLRELRRTMDWICKADFEIKIIVGGNHDVTLDPTFFAEQGHCFHDQSLEDPQKCLELISESPTVVFLQHESAMIRLRRTGGPNTIFKVFGSPYSQFQGNWAFGYDSSDATRLWGQIPLDTDIVVTHTPPQSHCDQKPNGTSVGCSALRKRLSLIRPHLAICGHVHEGRGYERVQWPAVLTDTEQDIETETHSPPKKETERQTPIQTNAVDHVIRGTLPPMGSKKQNLIDLTSKRNERLANEGFSWPGHSHSHSHSNSHSAHKISKSSEEPMSSASLNSSAGAAPEKETPRNSPNAPSLSAGSPSPSLSTGIRGTIGHVDALQTLRMETCIVNAAIVATSFPHHGGKRFNSPVVIDLELPVWQDLAHAKANANG
ncbi:uncharacterized protein N7511_009954 [Penicillium nucicola]|uniref:uncharacterized protein n=1 Tax=Penicillium nucicola TaxID=1850975 RepID=UPI00254552B9|nr:uncharacterized protein N7511_009954 [Penicillium nucicola]KAJ5748258.1 hypothetical protein N7511_009954 [Penicillium nucicola]